MTVSGRAAPHLSGTGLRAGFLGGGFMAAVHSRAARAAGARTVLLAGSTPERAALAAAELGIEKGAAGVAEAIEGSDVVHVCTPNARHAAQTLDALAAGRHVVCEKPLATTLDDASEVAAAAADSGRVAAVPFVYRYHPMVRRARALIAAGEAGAVLTVDGAYLQDWMLRSAEANWRADTAAGGASRAFADIGSHLCDLIEFVTGDRIVALSARTRTVHADRAGTRVVNEDLAAVVAELGNGALATLLVSQMAPGRKNGLVLEVHGSEKSVRFAQERPEELWIGGAEASQLVLREPGMPGDRGLSLVPSGHPMGYQDAFDAFIADVYAAARGEEREGMPTFADGLRAVRITTAVLASAADAGRWVDVAPH
ncbi:Gfo/Idh/MocA family oxidoreductase [Microbacterium sp.]|uniref:Gfo/Idh/MocA family protein n=1 Tax=Microbacterium sp. TaxID=51671 RepID=UPI00333EE84D